MLENEQEIIPQNEEQADQLLEQIETPSHEQQEEAATAPAPAPAEEFELTVGGKAIKANREKILKWAQMGYDAPTRIGQLSKEVETYKEQQARLKAEYEEKYGEIDKYVRENPKFWDHVTQSWQNKNQLLNDPSNPLATTVNELQQTVQGLLGKVTTYEQQEAQKRAAHEDSAYMQQLEGIQKKYPQIDFSTPDESGKSLEYKVLEFAQENGIRKFDTAFKAFYHDELVKLESEKAKESVVKERQKNSKLGILGITNSPTKKSSDDLRGKSHNDIAREIIEEMGLT